LGFPGHRILHLGQLRIRRIGYDGQFISDEIGEVALQDASAL
jgi:hypothetical protein